MQTFSIAAQQFGAFNFGVDASNTAIVTFSYPDPHDASRVLVARFNRNGEHVMTAEPPRVVPEPVTSPVPDPTPMPLPPVPMTDTEKKYRDDFQEKKQQAMTEPLPQVRVDQQLDASQRDVISSSGPGPVYDRAIGEGTSRDQST